MKRCPECRRDYYDDSLLYCLDDGTALLEGPASVEEPATAILHSTGPPSETETRGQIHLTDDKPVSPSVSEGFIARPRGFDKRLLAIPVVIGVVIGAFLGYRYLGAASKQINSIAVLPFANESLNAESEYLSDGMTESLIGSLSQIPNLNVKARASVFRYKGKEVNPKQIGQELSVQAILTGRLLQRANDLTLYVELIDTANENVLWKADYNRPMSNLVALQSEIAKDVSNKLKSRLSGEEQTQVAKTYTNDPEAYQLYLKGIYHWNKRTGDELRQAISLFQEAIEKDPGYAKAYGGLAMAYEVFGSNTASSKEEVKETHIKAKASALKALELDSELSEAHAVLAERKLDDEWDFAGSEASFKRAIELNPNFASAHQWYSEVLSRLGRADEALVEIKKAYEIDPFSRAVNMNLGLRLLEMRRYDEAKAQFEKLVQSEPDYPMAHTFLGGIYEDRGEFEKAIGPECRAEVLLEIETEESCAKKAIEMRKALKEGGPNGYWRMALEDQMKQYERGIGSSVAVAGIYARLGNKEKAFEWLEKAFAERATDITYLKVDTSFDSVRSDPRFVDLQRRIGLPV